MIKVDVLASSSNGNCYQVSDGETKLLLECGINISTIRKGLGFKLSDVSGCLISHSHQDHCKSVTDVIKSGIDVYLTQPTKDSLNLGDHRVHVIQPREVFKIGSWTIKPFETEHDCDGSVGFYMVSKAGRLVFITDSYYSRYRFKDVSVWMVEVNYDQQTLKSNIESGEVDPMRGKRVIRSHMSLENAIDLFKANDLSKTEHIYAIHLSRENTDHDLVKRRLAETTGKMITVCY